MCKHVVSGYRSIRHFWCYLDPHVCFFVKHTFRFDALAAESIQNGPFSGAAAEKDVAAEAQNAPAPGGPRGLAKVLF